MYMYNYMLMSGFEKVKIYSSVKTSSDEQPYDFIPAMVLTRIVTQKKVRFKDVGENAAENMVVDITLVRKISCKDKLWGRKGTGSLDCFMISDDSTDVDLKFQEGDILRSIINGIPTIDFSKRIKKVLFKDMETTAIVKLLGRNIGYGVLFNQITSHWKPSQPFCLMDMENGYYLVRFQNKND
ncbi:hypothetical protein J1N35_019175 [Gossypium stocksii]|uniref:DUF4283 domain-containing protein n=1 Tax=Gossypium stocksii TaxID=47602 RepID=A0A9D3VS35_9ROSI|nr:hypothetical protein J1N35_019175 [Gossypium stocksii]